MIYPHRRSSEPISETTRQFWCFPNGQASLRSHRQFRIVYNSTCTALVCTGGAGDGTGQSADFQTEIILPKVPSQPYFVSIECNEWDQLQAEISLSSLNQEKRTEVFFVVLSFA